MIDFNNLKIDDVYVFYFASGYVNANAEDEFTVGEIVGVNTQKELDNIIKDDSNHIIKCFQEQYECFIDNQDSGWYKKE